MPDTNSHFLDASYDQCENARTRLTIRKPRYGRNTNNESAGFIPALSSNQQIADGAIAAMAPILKQLFRGAGEGTFTDSDQKILNDMLPTRRDSAESAKSKLANIDAIVRAKLLEPDLNIEAATDQPKPDLSAMSLDELIKMRDQAK